MFYCFYQLCSVGRDDFLCSMMTVNLVTQWMKMQVCVIFSFCFKNNCMSNHMSVPGYFSSSATNMNC